MADTPKADIQIVRIAQEIPVVFVDAVSSQSFGLGITKMYLARYDPDPGLAGPVKETVVLQLVMPTESLVKTVAFLEHRVAQGVLAGVIKQEFVDEARKVWRDDLSDGAPNG